MKIIETQESRQERFNSKIVSLIADKGFCIAKIGDHGYEFQIKRKKSFFSFPRFDFAIEGEQLIVLMTPNDGQILLIKEVEKATGLTFTLYVDFQVDEETAKKYNG